MIRERSQELVSGVLPQITEILGQVKADATKISQSAQMDVLQETMAPEALMARLSQLVWHVVSVDNGGVILPDCTSIAFDGREWKPLILTSFSELKGVALPLAPNRLAIGKIDVDQTMDVSQFNRHAAHASETFFLSDHTSKELERLSEVSKGRIGMLTNRMVDSAVSEAVEETLNNLLEDDESVEKQYASKIAWKGKALESEQSFSISFKDFGDEAFGNAVAEEIKVLIIRLSEILPVSAIDGFTFACDYDSAILSLDRGFERRNKITLAKIEGFAGMGIPIKIVSEGKVKTRGVMRSGVAIDLVSDNEELVYNARSAVVHILASGALTNLMANKFPQQILKPVKDPYEAFLYGYTSQVFCEYFCASVSTWTERKVASFEKFAFSALQDTLIQIPDRRKEYKCLGDLNRFFEASAILVANMLMSLARLFGAYTACDLEISPDSCLVRLLAEHNLDQWSNLFRRDLAGFDADLEKWAEFKEIFFVHRHFERVMFHFGILPDRTNGQGAYIHILR